MNRLVRRLTSGGWSLIESLYGGTLTCCKCVFCDLRLRALHVPLGGSDVTDFCTRLRNVGLITLLAAVFGRPGAV